VRVVESRFFKRVTVPELKNNSGAEEKSLLPLTDYKKKKRVRKNTQWCPYAHSLRKEREYLAWALASRKT
jgi:hypothetical protein